MLKGFAYRELAPAIQAALVLIEEYGMEDGEHHKQWVIDQVVRTLLGPERYAEWIAAIEASDTNDSCLEEWDVGIAP